MRSAPNKSATVAVSLAPNIQKLFVENDIDLLSELRQLHVPVDSGSLPKHYRSTYSGRKSAEWIILASGVSTTFLAWSISQVIRAISDRDTVVYESNIEDKAVPLPEGTSPKPKKLRLTKKQPAKGTQIKLSIFSLLKFELKDNPS
jgi:hypothetical protein